MDKLIERLQLLQQYNSTDPLYLDNLSKLEQYVNSLEGIGCNQCYSCISGGSYPCLNDQNIYSVSQPRRSTRQTHMPLRTGVLTGKDLEDRWEEYTTHAFEQFITSDGEIGKGASCLDPIHKCLIGTAKLLDLPDIYKGLEIFARLTDCNSELTKTAYLKAFEKAIGNKSRLDQKKINHLINKLWKVALKNCCLGEKVPNCDYVELMLLLLPLFSGDRVRKLGAMFDILYPDEGNCINRDDIYRAVLHGFELLEAFGNGLGIDSEMDSEMGSEMLAYITVYETFPEMECVDWETFKNRY